MSNNVDLLDKRHVFAECDDKYVCKVRRSGHNNRPVYEYEKKLKREIANSNERRRMQSINTGFENLKQLLPMSVDGEKLSKASILQLTAKYIETLLVRLSALEREITCCKKSAVSKHASKSPCSVSQDQSRKRRLASCLADAMADSDSEGGAPGGDKAPGSLEHLVAAIEQVEGERFYEERVPACSAAAVENGAVMRPTISPYTEKIILAVSQHAHIFSEAAVLSPLQIDRSPPSDQ